jgi:predicted DNA-binding transcriptional regulator AlpA
MRNGDEVDRGGGQRAYMAFVGRRRGFAVMRVVGSQDPSTHDRGDVANIRAPERYLSRAELAATMGLSLATVDRMVAEGMPSVTWGRRTRRFRPSAALSWASERERVA